MRSPTITYNRATVRSLYRMLESGRLCLEEKRKLKVRLTMARLRIEDQGKDPTKLGFEPRVRRKRGTVQSTLELSARNRFKGGGLVFHFDDLTTPIHGDALERLARI
jgi:hypothetical protein